MSLRLIFIGVLTLLFNLYSAQTDSVICNADFRINEGVFLSYSDFRRNAPVGRGQIETTQNKDQLDFFGKVLTQPKITYDQGGEKITRDSKSVWGFYQNNALHLNYNGEFYRVPVFGAISYMVATVEVANPALYSPMYGGGVGMTMGMGGKSEELRSFLMNFYEGGLQPFSMDLAEQLLSRDPELYKEFKALKNRQRKEQVSRYIRKYNERHPVYFLK